MEPEALLQYGALGILALVGLLAVKILWGKLSSEREENKKELAAERKAHAEELAAVNSQLLDVTRDCAEEYRMMIEKIGSVLESLTHKIEARAGNRRG